jgi:hypothetical protein
MSDALPQAFQGTAPSDVLARYPELHNANTAAPPPPVPYKPLPWWRCLFRRWEEPEFISVSTLHGRYDGREVSANASLYKQRNRCTGRYCYFIRSKWGQHPIDAVTYERTGTVVFLS